MLYELRVYDIAPGRSKALLDRFANYTLAIFKKYDIKPVLFMEPVIGTGGQLVYLLQWNSLAERETRWNAFYNSPEWTAAKAATETEGPLALRITNSILSEVPSLMTLLQDQG